MIHILVCWHCNTGEWSLYVGIVTLVSGPHMLGLLHWRVALYIGIAILVSGPYIVGLLYW